VHHFWLTYAAAPLVCCLPHPANCCPAPPIRLQEFELACPPPDFWCRFLANQSDFFRHFHTARGDSAIRLSKWQRHFKVSPFAR
jgi:hypothetical protein